MRIEHIHDKCTGCTACKTVCPTKCITMELDGEGFYFPQIDTRKCIGCGKCERVCHCFAKNELNIEKTSYWGYHKDAVKRFSSTSGGVFIALADEIIRRGGVVYGAAFDNERRKLRHTSNLHAPLEKLQKSKYIESDLENTFSEIQEHLKNGRYVLFCGTPCEASGLRKAVADSENRLYIVDFICHGVPSSGLFREHLEYVIKKRDTLIDIDFRPKSKGWIEKNIEIKTQKGIKTRPYIYDSFYKGFMTENAFLRRSCYNCEHRQEHSSDITIADFWGYRQYDPSINDEKGLSLIVANNAKGRQLAESVAGDFVLNKIDNKYSDYAYAPKDYSESLKKRKIFYSYEKRYGFEKAAKMTYMKNGEMKYMIYRVKRLIKQILKNKSGR